MSIFLPSRLLACGALAVSLAVAAAMPVLAQDQQPAAPDAAAPALTGVVATVEGKPISAEDLALAEQDLDPQFARLPVEQRRAAALSAIIEIRLMAAEAEKAGYADSEDFARRMAFLRDRSLHGAYVEKNIAEAVTEEEVRARYDKEVAGATPTNEVRARHILVKTKEEADAIVKQLDEGGDFEAIAKEKSSDPGSGAQGGDLGYFAQGQMVPEFEKAAFALEVGAFTKEPVQSQFGFHVIKLEDKRVQQPPAFDQVKDQVRSVVLREKYFQTVTDLRKKADVQIDDPALKAVVDGIDAAKN